MSKQGFEKTVNVEPGQDELERTSISVDATQRIQSAIGQYVITIANLEARISMLTSKVKELGGKA